MPRLLSFPLSPQCLAAGLSVATLCAVLSLPATAQTPRLEGDEFTVNSFTGGDQIFPAIAAQPGGSFVVAWEGGAMGDIDGISMQRFDPSGAAVGLEQRVNTTLAGEQTDADIAVFDDGSFIVVWDDGLDIFGQRFDAMGQPQGSELAINQTMVQEQNDAAVAGAPDGSFMIAWEITRPGDLEDIVAQRFDAAGLPIGAEIAVNSTTLADQEDVDIASDAAGNFVVVWESEGQDGNYDSVIGRRFATDGSAIGDEFQVNSYTQGDQDDPFLAVRADGSFAVTWEDDSQDNFVDGIRARYFNADATPASDEFKVDQAAGREMNPRIALDSQGEAVIIWDALASAPTDLEVMINAFDANGVAKGPEQSVNVTNFDDQVEPALALGSDDRGLAAWIDDTGDGDGAAIKGRRFEVPLFTDGFESGNTENWSATIN